MASTSGASNRAEFDDDYAYRCANTETAAQSKDRKRNGTNTLNCERQNGSKRPDPFDTGYRQKIVHGIAAQGGTGHDPLCIALAEPTTGETGKRSERGRLAMRGPPERSSLWKGAWLGGRDTRRLARVESICHTLALLFSRAYNLERTRTWTIGN